MLMDAAGNPQYLIGLTEDITEREGAQETLQEGENLFRSIFENAQIDQHIGKGGGEAPWPRSSSVSP